MGIATAKAKGRPIPSVNTVTTATTAIKPAIAKPAAIFFQCRLKKLGCGCSSAKFSVGFLCPVGLFLSAFDSVLDRVFDSVLDRVFDSVLDRVCSSVLHTTLS